MTPKQYEEYIGELYREKGYTVEVTKISNDYGVDIFASKGEERIAIQAKMYGNTSRKINRQMIMELHGAKDYFKCTHALIATNGQILETAKKVAEQLGIEILSTRNLFINLSDQSDSYIDGFEKIWLDYIKPLEGKTLAKENGKNNVILKVDWSGIERITSNRNKQKIKIEIFRLAVEKILSTGSVTRAYINQEYKERASSGIVLILSQVPFFKYYSNPARIFLDNEKYNYYKINNRFNSEK